jgi:hypothetical protein
VETHEKMGMKTIWGTEERLSLQLYRWDFEC